MRKVLLVSVGGSAEPIVGAIVQAQPELVFVYFLCSTGKAGSEAAVGQTIVPGAKLAEGSYAIERVEAPDTLRDVVDACARIEADLDARFAGDDLSVVVNYTGGTKTMSAGLVALAQRRGWHAEVTERPAPKSSGPVSKVILEAVTVFERLEVSCSRGINVIIGENGTGKTHLLKCMYALLRKTEETETALPVPSWDDKLERVLKGSARSFFAAKGEPSRVTVECESARFERTEEIGATASWTLPPAFRVRALFLPSRETLAMADRFVSLYDSREISFDETYYDLCRVLEQAPLREPRPDFGAVLEELEGLIGGRVRLDGNTFFVDTRRGMSIAAPMVAEGHRKLASLAYLIKNGALTNETILFWDEPEANLNPRLVRVVVQVIRKLARAGVQIFVATHDYLLARELSLEAEYKPEEVETLFFALHRAPDDGPVEVESSNAWSHLKHNAIVDAHADHYDRAQDLFAEASPEEPS